MRVNTSAKVANLNADKLDGRSAPLLLQVAANGDLGSNDTVAKVTHTANSGYYEFEFLNRAVTGCVYQATLVNGPDGGEIAVYPSGAVANRLDVITTRNGLDFNARYDRPFHLVLWCCEPRPTKVASGVPLGAGRTSGPLWHGLRPLFRLFTGDLAHLGDARTRRGADN